MAYTNNSAYAAAAARRQSDRSSDNRQSKSPRILTPSYEVRIDGALAASGVGLTAPGAIDTMRFATDGLNEVYFLDRTFDDISIVAE